MQTLKSIAADHEDCAEAHLVFDLINGRQTPLGVVQTISQQGDASDDDFSHLGKLQNLMLHLATDAPSTHASLVALLVAFRQCREKTIGDGIWGTFGMNEGDLHSSLMYDPRSASDYINLNGFEAQLWRALGNVVEEYILGHPLRNFAPCIENATPAEEHQTVDVEIAAACLWMIHGSERLWRLCAAGDGFSDGKDWRGDLWTGEMGYSVERWGLWSRRFKNIADGEVEGVGRETRELAMSALSNMAAAKAYEG